MRVVKTIHRPSELFMRIIPNKALKDHTMMLAPSCSNHIKYLNFFINNVKYLLRFETLKKKFKQQNFVLKFKFLNYSKSVQKINHFSN